MSYLRYTTPAGWAWDRAFPIGCGKLGAMIFGGADSEHFQMNEDSIWYGGPLYRVNPDAKPNLSKVRQLIFDGRIHEAERLLKMAFSAVPQSERSYQTAGDLYLDFCESVKKPMDFERILDLETAVHTVRVKDEESGIAYTRETIASYPRNCIITRITADRPASVSLSALINREGFCDFSGKVGNMTYYGGNLGKSGLDYVCGMKLIAKGAEITSLGEHLLTEHADEAVVLWTAETTFRSENPLEIVKKRLDAVASVDFESLKKEHTEDYRKLFGAVSLELEEPNKVPASLEEELSEAARENAENRLMKTYFDFGRYLLIASSRPGSLPANLQGIWNRDYAPAWGSKFTININTEMNYWPAEMFGLSECHLPLFDLLQRLAENGEKVAEEMYGCRGFVAHHNTDIWADCAPQDMYTPATIWPMGGAWLCTHVWQHYQYTKDFEFLKKMYPVVKESVRFFFDYLVEKDGELVTCPTTSPENTYILPNGERGCVCYGATMDSQILRDLLGEFLKEAEIVGETDEEFLAEAAETLKKLPKTKIGKEGRIVEWSREYEEAEPGHRHISHLYGLHPSHQIQMETTPELATAARKTLETRLAGGGGHTGWSRAWIMNFYARLWDGEACYRNFVQLLAKSTLPNLFDNHPPFQIDGNFGAVAAVGEMLLQSVENRVYLLPALPKRWESGSIEGIRACGGAAFSIYWKEGVLSKVRVTAETTYHGVIMYQGEKAEVTLFTGETKELFWGDNTFC